MYTPVATLWCVEYSFAQQRRKFRTQPLRHRLSTTFIQLLYAVQFRTAQFTTLSTLQKIATSTCRIMVKGTFGYDILTFSHHVRALTCIQMSPMRTMALLVAFTKSLSRLKCTPKGDLDNLLRLIYRFLKKKVCKPPLKSLQTYICTRKV